MAERRVVTDDFVGANQYIEEQGWTDGLPVIPPTEALVSGMLEHTRRAPDEVLGRMEPLQGTVTVEKVAANAVMAGCRPEYFPVVLAAVRAVMQPQFHVGSTACTTGGSAPVLVVNGPIGPRLGINAGTACFGGNVKANATIGRALRLVMRNLGGAKPNGMEKSTHAWPGKISCCFAENEARSPWPAFSVDRGYAAGTSTVTALAVRGLYGVTEGVQTTGEGVLETIVASMRYVGSPIYHQMNARIPVMLVLSPEHAEEIAGTGLDKAALRERLFRDVRLPVRELKDRGYHNPGAWPADLVDEANPDSLVPMVASPDLFWVVVAGGDGRHSSWLPAWNVCRGASEAVEE